MNIHLKQIQNWSELAKEANWSASELAQKCGVSVRTLQRYFLRKFNKGPRIWLAEQRQYLAIELLRNGFTVKETAASLGYQHANNFSRKFRSIRRSRSRAGIGKH